MTKIIPQSGSDAPSKSPSSPASKPQTSMSPTLKSPSRLSSSSISVSSSSKEGDTSAAFANVVEAKRIPRGWWSALLVGCLTASVVCNVVVNSTIDVAEIVCGHLVVDNVGRGWAVGEGNTINKGVGLEL